MAKQVTIECGDLSITARTKTEARERLEEAADLAFRGDYGPHLIKMDGTAYTLILTRHALHGWGTTCIADDEGFRHNPSQTTVHRADSSFKAVAAEAVRHVADQAYGTADANADANQIEGKIRESLQRWSCGVHRLLGDTQVETIAKDIAYLAVERAKALEDESDQADCEVRSSVQHEFKGVGPLGMPFHVKYTHHQHNGIAGGLCGGDAEVSECVRWLYAQSSSPKCVKDWAAHVEALQVLKGMRSQMLRRKKFTKA